MTDSKMDELVSKQKVIDLIDRFNVFESRGDQIALECMVRELPSAQPEPKHGKWLECDVFDEHNITEWQSAKCSVCGHYHTTPYLYNFTCYSFCPHCGARMEVTE